MKIDKESLSTETVNVPIKKYLELIQTIDKEDIKEKEIEYQKILSDYISISLNPNLGGRTLNAELVLKEVISKSYKRGWDIIIGQQAITSMIEIDKNSIIIQLIKRI